MRWPLLLGIAILQMILAQTTLDAPALAQTQTARPHNVVLFIAELRARMVDDHLTPTMAAIARDGVNLRNSHALFPTFTMANASGMATGHLLGDTGRTLNRNSPIRRRRATPISAVPSHT
jgi:predicted AlkP superfamily pyrophosphatase or phosphodiesterase